MTACLSAIASWLSAGGADIDTLPWASLRFTHTTAVRAALARAVSESRYAPATANKHLAALRGALKAAWRLGLMSTEDYMRAVDLRPVPGSRLPAGRDVDQDELAALLMACAAHGGPAGTRDAAVISLAYLSGTRRAELAALHVADVELDPPALRVIGKGLHSARRAPSAFSTGSTTRDLSSPWCASSTAPTSTDLAERGRQHRASHRRCVSRLVNEEGHERVVDPQVLPVTPCR